MPPSRELSPFHQFLIEVTGSLSYDTQKPVDISKLKLWVPNPTDGVTKKVQTYLMRQRIKHKVHFINSFDATRRQAPWNDNWLVLGFQLEPGSSTVKSIEDDILAHMPPNSILSVCAWGSRRCYFFPLERQDLTHQFYNGRGRYQDLLLLRDHSVWDESQFHTSEDEIFADAVRRQLCPPLSSGEGCPICRLSLTNQHSEDPDELDELLQHLSGGVVVCAPCGHSFHLECIEPFWEQRESRKMCPMCNTEADSVHTVTNTGPADCQKILSENPEKTLLLPPWLAGLPGPDPAPSSLERLLPRKVQPGRVQKEATAKLRYDPLRRSSRYASPAPGPWQAPGLQW